MEIYFHEWGYVCDDSWDKNDADVACRQLGYSRSSSSNTEVLIENREFPYLIDDVECTGDEEKLIDCTHTSRHNCGSGEHVQISCETTGKYCSSFSILIWNVYDSWQINLSRNFDLTSALRLLATRVAFCCCLG